MCTLPWPLGARRPARAAAAWPLLAAFAFFSVACHRAPSAPSDVGTGPGGTAGTSGTSSSVPVPQVAGEYTLTLGGGVCKWSPLPWDLMNRTYRVSLAQQHSGLHLTFSDARFEGHQPGSSPAISGRLEPLTGTATFDLPKPLNGWWNEWAPDWAPVTEVLADGSRLEIEGAVQATIDPSGLSGTFKGMFRYTASGLGPHIRSGSCESDHHRFALTR